MDHPSRIVDAMPRLLEGALKNVTQVFLRHQEPCTFRSPPLGTLGGAGNPQTSTRFVLELVGLKSSQQVLLGHAIRQSILTPRQIYLRTSYSAPTCRILNFQVGDLENTLVVVAEGASSLSRGTLEIRVHKKTFVWRIATQRH